MNYTKLPKKALLLLATPVMFSLAVPASKLVAQSQTETKIRLMAEGLRARDNGDLSTAKTNFEQLLVLAPNDVTVQRLLSGVNESIAKGATASVPAVVASSEPVEVVYDPSGKTKPAATPAAEAVEVAVPASVTDANASEPAAPAVADQASVLAAGEEARVKKLLANTAVEAKAANRLAKDGDFDGATVTYDTAIRSLPVNTLTEDTIANLEGAKNELLLRKSQALLKQGDTVGAQAALDAYVAATSPEGKAARKQAARIDKAELNPGLQPIEKANPGFIPEQKEIVALLSRGRSQYVAGDIDGAQETFRLVETYSADNAEAKYFLKRIAEEKTKIGTLNREKTRALMLEEVAKGWQRGGVFKERNIGTTGIDDPSSDKLKRKLEGIIIPAVSFNNQDLGNVISTLGALSSENDTKSAETDRGVNLILGNSLAGAPAPKVNITLRTPMSLKRILDIITENVGYQYDIQPDLVLIKPSGTDVNLDNEQFAVSKSAIVRMTGSGSSSSPTPSASADPFAPPAPAGGGGGGSSGGESDAIRRFLQAAGVPFDTVPGASLAYDGASILVTHTSRNIERIRNILGRYNDVRQVEIEAKFMDVTEGALDELGVAWQTAFTENGNDYTLESGNRTLANAFTGSASANSGGSIVIPGEAPIRISNTPPSLPGTVDLGGDSMLGTFTGGFGDVSVEAQLRALSRRQGSDLLSAPKITVLSGNRATITVAQELRYPQSYGEIESDVGTASESGGSAGVTITAGTPEDFATRNVGVELAVTPTVEEDDYSISLELNPRVTEFEGFVEYGGQSVAIAGGGITGSSIVTVPSGFYQPIFSTREINTRVTVWDGATLVMGGLTREEVRRVNDKVPFLGDIPFLGRAFRSKGEASTKRNLLVFVTANLVSPGGSLKKQALRGVVPSSMFQNPTVVTPGGSEARIRVSSE